jgi:hypothetical protein
MPSVSLVALAAKKVHGPGKNIVQKRFYTAWLLPEIIEEQGENSIRP